MPKSNNPCHPGGMEEATLGKYYWVVENPSEQKNQGETPQTDEVNTLLDNTNTNNDKSTSTSSNTSTNNNKGTKETTTTTTDTATTNVMQQNNEQLESINEESEEKTPINSKIPNDNDLQNK